MGTGNQGKGGLILNGGQDDHFVHMADYDAGRNKALAPVPTRAANVADGYGFTFFNQAPDMGADYVEHKTPRLVQHRLPILKTADTHMRTNLEEQSNDVRVF